MAIARRLYSSFLRAQLRRWPLRNNHTATHILNWGLREVLGDHIDQKGSLVAPTKLRFDFSHKAGITAPELEKIENLSNDWIKRNVKVYGQDMGLKAAYAIPGLRAVFGEAYPDPVRVVSLGYALDEIAADINNPKWRQASIEFCGGTCVFRLRLRPFNTNALSDTSSARATSRTSSSPRSLASRRAYVGLSR
jgi:alanyl-tRNA synthetase